MQLNRFTYSSAFRRFFLVLLFLWVTSFVANADDAIPSAAWCIPIGQAPANPGGRKPELSPAGNIDDGYWQGAPVGGFGAGTFSRSYRGHYERWHVKAGVHKYQDVPTNQFAVFIQPEGGEPVAQVLAAGKPQGGQLSAGNWS
jgi:non-lysosomal glucosylceramidase